LPGETDFISHEIDFMVQRKINESQTKFLRGFHAGIRRAATAAVKAARTGPAAAPFCIVGRFSGACQPMGWPGETVSEIGFLLY
jgi:hypothetical protein